jgi:opacity protein-like surface antigen
MSLKLKTLPLIICASIGALGSSAYATEDPFSGFSIGIAAKSQTFIGEVTDYAVNGTAIPTTTLSFEKTDQSKTIGELVLKYSAALTDKYYLGLSYELGLGDTNLKVPNATLLGVTSPAADSVKVKSIQSLVLSPGYRVNQATLVSLRLGYATSKIEIASAGEPTDKIDSNGLLTGIGVDYAISKNLLIGASYDLYSLDTKTVSGTDSDGDDYSYKWKPEGSALRFSLSYKF